jgi:HAD superfamily hydrolase (TIGR01549 family)
VLGPTGCNPPTFDFLKSYIGLHLDVLFRDVLPHFSESQKEELVQQYRAAYPLRRHASTHRFPGVAEALAALGGKKTTATTKGTVSTRSILDQFGLLQYFDHVQGTDGFPAKPEPDVILTALGAVGATPQECLMVGDAPSDMEAGRRAGAKICAVRYGYGDPHKLARWEPDYWVDDLRELTHAWTGSGAAMLPVTPQPRPPVQ